MNCWTTFISAQEAHEHLNSENFVFIDCSWSLANDSWGIDQYNKGHIKGAFFASLKQDLSGPVMPTTGRHPLPSKQNLVEFFSSLGITASSQVIAYDSTQGYMAASRLWWLLKWAGHDCVAVLDGGKSVWQEAGYELSIETSKPTKRDFQPSFRDELLVSAIDVESFIKNPSICIIDSRTADRYAGQNETIDPVAGHIPTAISMPFNAGIASGVGGSNLEFTKNHFAAAEGYSDQVFYCGSGVTATYNILMFLHSRGYLPKLYAGSWSEWITDPSRPIE